MDESAHSFSLEVNGAVMRRALKSQVNDVFRLGDWNSLTTSVKASIDKRFVPGDDKLTADDFYMQMCSQVFQKMLRTASQKFKPKAG